MNVIKNKLPPPLPDNTYVAMDSEWFRMVLSRIHRPWTGKFACLTFCYRPGEVYLYTDTGLVHDLLRQIDNCVWIFHHAKFDLTQLRRHAIIKPRTRLIDTMLIERILWNGYYETFSQEDLARRYLHYHLDKSLQKKWATIDEMTPEMEAYAVEDADVLLRIWNEQKKYLTKELMKVYKTIDLPALWAAMDFRGFGLNVPGWRELAENNKAEADRLKATLEFNPNSNKVAVNWYREHGFKGISDNQGETLEKFIDKYPDTEAATAAKVALECKQLITFSSRYGKRWLDDFLEMFPDGSYGFVPDFYIIGAETGRLACSDPPLNQVPSRTTKVFREQFIARPGCKLIIGDYAAQEVFVMAYITQDEKMMEICNSGKDIYVMMAKMMYGVDIEKKDPLRKRMKAVVLGIDYGMTEHGLAKKEGIGKIEAAFVIQQFRDTFPKIAQYIDMMERKKNKVYTVSGRVCHLNRYSSQCPRNALNSPIQGTAADIMKLAIAMIHQDWCFDCEFGIVNVIHDEIVLDVPEEFAEDVRMFTQTRMVAAAKQICPGMNFRADCVIGDKWSDKE